jgi:putative membrane protein
MACLDLEFALTYRFPACLPITTELFRISRKTVECSNGEKNGRPSRPNSMDGWGYVTMAINMVLFWGLIILGLIGLFRYLASGDRSTTSRDTSEHLLAERFARGEIDEQKYHQRLEALRGTPRSHVRSSGHGRWAA